MSLRCSVTVPGRLDADVEAGAGEVLAVLGPNGSGKTTLLRSIAGTLPARAEVRVEGSDWSRLPPHERSVGFVHQEHQLFPHLSALENVAFGPRARGAGRGGARRTAADWLERLGLAGLADRRPAELSGGQAQRVAIARALAIEPRVLLLDEPFAALDVAVAIGLRDVLQQHLEEYVGTVLLATHDSLDVEALADRVVVLEGGRVAQHDDLAAVAETPRTAHAARLLGLNVLRGQAGVDGVVQLAEGGVLVTADDHTGPVLATFPPSAITITSGPPGGSARNVWALRVRSLAESGPVVRLHLQGAHDLRGDVTRGAAAQLDLAPGREVWASVKATEVTVFPAATAGPNTPGRPINSGA